jgi:hypothetical protein
VEEGAERQRAHKILNMKIAENFTVENFLHPAGTQEVKIFVDKDPREAEKNINAWLKENKVYIHHVGQSQSEKSGNFLFTISIFYSAPA